MGKYDHIVPNLPRTPDRSPRQGAIEELKRRLTAGPNGAEVTYLAEAYITFRQERDLLKGQLEENQLYLDALVQLLVASQEGGEGGWGLYGASAHTLRLPSGASIRVQPEPVGEVLDKEAFRLWCVKNGYERQLQLWPSRTQSIVKERLLAGQPQPDGIEVSAIDKIVYTSAKTEASE